MKTFYRPEMVSHEAKSFSPSAAKPQQVVDDLLRSGIIKKADVMEFKPATREHLYLAHDRDYVDGVLDLDIENGFGNTSADVARSLLYTTGSMIAASEYAVKHNARVLSPTSGFHHAGWDFGGGFCTFNGLIVALVALYRAGLIDSASIIDCDAHYGNGTADIIKRKKLDWIQHHTAGAHFTDRSEVRDYDPWLRRALKRSEDVSLVIYQAGADPHVDDPLGGILTSSEMFERDMRVHHETLGQPMVWNLAGGYQRDVNGSIEPVLKLHRKTAQVLSGQYTQ
jgi:acetoin utilization deacetylase AcuC-like enzyme